MRRIDPDAIASHASRRFRSEYDYALFEYYRSAKVFKFLEQAGVAVGGSILDAGCGGGGMPLSFAEEARQVVGIDLAPRFGDAGHRLAAERGFKNLHFARADGQALPFPDASFDMVLSHAVIEHVADAALYMRELARVLKPGGTMYLSTAPYLSFAGAHLPRLVVPVPLHLLLGRRLSFGMFVWLARHAPWALQEAKEANTFVALAEQGREKQDDLLQRVTLRRLAAWIEGSGLAPVREDRHVTGFFRRALPGPLLRLCARTPLLQDVMIGHIQCVLERPA